MNFTPKVLFFIFLLIAQISAFAQRGYRDSDLATGSEGGGGLLEIIGSWLVIFIIFVVYQLANGEKSNKQSR